MGLAYSSIWNSLSGGAKLHVRILMVGLDGAGKTTLLNQFKQGKAVETIQTIGFNVETIEFKNFHLVLWDIGGMIKIRHLWKDYYQNTKGIIFVVDSNDRDRIDEARDELQKLLNEEELRESVVLIYANKRELSNAMSGSEIIERLGLHKYSNRKWAVFACSARHGGDGLYEGLDWLNHELYVKIIGNKF